MDLKSFVAETLVQIVEGVADAQKRIATLEVGAAVNPGVVSEDARRKIGSPKRVQFDVAVTVSDESASRTGAGATAGFLSVVSARVDAKAEASDTLKNEAVSRIQFSVDLSQPADLITRSSTRGYPV
jgi:hypothetical protein